MIDETTRNAEEQIENIQFKHYNKKLCVGVCTLKNGFMIVEWAAKSNPNILYGEPIGERIVYGKLLEKIIALEAYKSETK